VIESEIEVSLTRDTSISVVLSHLTIYYTPVIYVHMVTRYTCLYWD